MEEIFSKLNSLNGVVGTAIFDLDGKVLTESLVADQPRIDYAAVAHNVQEVSYLLDSLSDSGGPEVLLQGARVQAFVRKEGQYFIMVLVDKHVNISPIAISINSVVAKARDILSRPDLQVPSGKSSGGGSGGVVASSGAHQITGARMLGQAGALSVATPQRRKGSVSAIGDWAAGPPPADAVGVKFVNHIFYVCELFLGTSAREVLVREMKALAVSPSTLSVRNVQDLIDRLSQYLEDSRSRKDFRDKILGDG